MKYYKYSELVREYSVSDKTVRNWVDASLQGKLDLKLFEKNGRYYVADSVANNVVLNSLAEKGKKYRNSRTSKTLEVKKEFYDLYTPDQVMEIVNALEKNRELPWSYSYVGEAASYWDEYLMELYTAGEGNMITNTISALKLNYPFIEALINDYDSINVINICTGNGIALHDILSRIKAAGKLNRFIAADISRDMLDITERNVDRWFDGKVKTEKCFLDIRNHPLELMNSGQSPDHKTVNIFFMVAGPLVNFEYPQRVLQTINSSMAVDDLLVMTIKRDTPETRKFFDFNTKSDNSLLGTRRRMLLDLMNIDESYYDVEQYYSEKGNQSYISVKLKYDLTFSFEVFGQTRAVRVEKGESILLWRAHEYSDDQVTQQLSQAGFSQLLTAQTTDRQMLLTVSTLERRTGWKR